MHFEYFGLKKNPFLLDTVAQCVFFGRSQCDAVANLLYGMRESRGIVLLLGEAGTGKTTLLRAALALLGPTVVTPCVLFNPMMETAQDLLYSVLAGFKINVGHRPAMELMGALHAFLEDQMARGLRPLLVVDEAQHLDVGMLEKFRLISNLESDGRRLLQLVLSAQPELGERLSTPQLQALRQRIVVRCRLQRLQPAEVWPYLALRIARAGGDGRLIFQPEATGLLAGYSQCVPRLLNVLADHCLIAAFARGENEVCAEVVRMVARSLELTADESRVTSPAGAHLPSAATWQPLVEEYRNYKMRETLLRFAESMRSQPAVESALPA